MAARRSSAPRSASAARRTGSTFIIGVSGQLLHRHQRVRGLVVSELSSAVRAERGQIGARSRLGHHDGDADFAQDVIRHADDGGPGHGGV